MDKYGVGNAVYQVRMDCTATKLNDAWFCMVDFNL